MPQYKVPVRDIKFILNDFLDLGRYSNMPGFEDATEDMSDAIIDAASQIAEDVLFPINQGGDEEGCTFKDGDVTTPKGFKEAYDTYTKGGWTGLTNDPDYGGQGMPYVIGAAINEMVCASNMAFGMYPGLTHGAYSAIHAHGSDEQKQMYLPKMTSGEWTGTMNLTEPHCGTDLGLIRTKAEPAGDGAYKITGQKIFISAGEHDLAANIIHLVLAKIPDGPEGVKGISLFVVPKFLVNEDGSLGARNTVTVGSIEEKMGIHANSTCVMNYDGATGWLVGMKHKGLRAMFTMMNEARWGVGMQGLGQSEIAYQNAAQYAKDRLQGRALTGPKEREKKADPLLVHPDIRRMLLNQKAFNEGARALLYYTAIRLDIAHKHPDEGQRQAADDFASLIMPVAKGYVTDKAFEYCVSAQQVFGGHGYIREWGMDQFVRDSRIAMIYEGANGVQALDLVGRKLGQNGGRAMMAFGKEITDFIASCKDDDRMAPFTKPLEKAGGRMQKATMWLMQHAMKNPDNAGAASHAYMHLFGIVALTYMWAMMARTAMEQIDTGSTPEEAADPFYANKLKTAHYFMDQFVPETSSLVARIEKGSESMMALEEAAF